MRTLRIIKKSQRNPAAAVYVCMYYLGFVPVQLTKEPFLMGCAEDAAAGDKLDFNPEEFELQLKGKRSEDDILEWGELVQISG